MLYWAQKSTVPILSQFCPNFVPWIQGGYNLDTKFRIHQLCHAVDGPINLEYGDIILILLAVFECWEDSIRFSKMDIAKN